VFDYPTITSLAEYVAAPLPEISRSREVESVGAPEPT
jgi:hypothetical protein